MSDRISLTIPRERPFHRVAHLVLGGLAMRHNLTLEQLEDLELALDALLVRDRRDGEVCLELEVAAQRVAAELGPFDPAALRKELDRDAGDGTLGLARVLGAVVDDVELSEREDGLWVRLVKGVQVTAEAT